MKKLIIKIIITLTGLANFLMAGVFWLGGITRFTCKTKWCDIPKEDVKMRIACCNSNL